MLKEEMAVPARATEAADQEFRHAMARCPSTVAVVAALGPTGPTGCAASAFLSLSIRPPALLVSLASHSGTLLDIVQSRRFAVSVLSHDQHDLVTRFATGRRHDRFTGTDFTVRHGAPVLHGATAAVVCRLTETLPVLDHTLVVGLATWTSRTDGRSMVLIDGLPHVPFREGRPR